MLKGYYALTSGMLTQSRNLNVISNNMTNVSTPGYKRDTAVSTTFGDILQYRTGSINKRNPTALGQTSMITVIDEVVTNFGQGSLDPTERSLDFALQGDGFFSIQGQDGIVYTRNGSFTLDNEGYLTLQHVGRVLGEGGPIQLNTDRIRLDPNGAISTADNDFGNFAIVSFANPAELLKVGEGMFQNANPDNAMTNEEAFSPSKVLWKTLERSNATPMDEMTAMMSSQRALQSSAQMLKMYDQLMSKAVTEIGRI